jgi:hypothetical protein
VEGSSKVYQRARKLCEAHVTQQMMKEGFSLSQAIDASGQDKKRVACLLHVPAIPYRNLRAAEELTLCQRPRISEKAWPEMEALESLTLGHA